MSLISVRASWTCHACFATAESTQLVSVLEQAIRRDHLLLTPPSGWQQTNTHTFCASHGAPLPRAAERLALPDEHHDPRLRAA